MSIMRSFLSKLGNGFSPRKPTVTGTKVSLQLMSDLHLEVGQQYATFNFPVAAPFLILAGDIGRLADYDAYLDFLARQTARYGQVVLVLGNHEFYGLDSAKGLSEAKRLESEPRLGGKLSVLQQTRVDLPGSNITLLGCRYGLKYPTKPRTSSRARSMTSGELTVGLWKTTTPRKSRTLRG